MYGAIDGGATLAGHVIKATYNPTGSSMPTWQDLTLNPVTNDQVQFNYYGLDISSIFIDPHDVTGNTVYVTVEGAEDPLHSIRSLYRTTDGGAHWSQIVSNLPHSPANAVVVDPQDANTIYVATDEGVYSTRQVATCANGAFELLVGLWHRPSVCAGRAVERLARNHLAQRSCGRNLWTRHLADSVMDFGNTVNHSFDATKLTGFWGSACWNNKQRSINHRHQ